MHLEIGSSNPYLQTAFIHAAGCRIDRSSSELVEFINKAADSARKESYSAACNNAKKAIRDMLRWGGFKPAGRNKPASEYIINNSITGNFPFILNAVDINNLISLLYYLPVSTIDASRTSGNFIIREGADQEGYIFNSSGQFIDIEGLITVYDNGVPTANCIKDSQRTKVSRNTDEIAVFLYSSKLLYNDQQLSGILDIYCSLLRDNLSCIIRTAELY